MSQAVIWNAVAQRGLSARGILWYIWPGRWQNKSVSWRRCFAEICLFIDFFLKILSVMFRHCVPVLCANFTCRFDRLLIELLGTKFENSLKSVSLGLCRYIVDCRKRHHEEKEAPLLAISILSTPSSANFHSKALAQTVKFELYYGHHLISWTSETKNVLLRWFWSKKVTKKSCLSFDTAIVERHEERTCWNEPSRT